MHMLAQLIAPVEEVLVKDWMRRSRNALSYVSSMASDRLAVHHGADYRTCGGD
jgi:hypothetical protein